MTARTIPITISEDELLSIINNTRFTYNKAAYIVAFYQAMRVSEIVKLQQEDINYQTRLIHIHQAKGNKDRVIPIAPEAVKALKAFPLKVGIRALQKSFKKNSFQSISKDVHFHCLRHSGATFYLNKKNWSTRQVQQFLGHSKIQTTEIYTHVTPNDLLEKMYQNFPNSEQNK